MATILKNIKFAFSNQHIMPKATFFLSFLLFFACKSDKPIATPEQLAGKWNIVQATKEGKIFEAISGGYFDFGKDAKFETNIPSLPSGSNFTLKDGIISFQSDTIKYTISHLNDSTLVVDSNIRNTKFQFTCKKTVEM